MSDLLRNIYTFIQDRSVLLLELFIYVVGF